MAKYSNEELEVEFKKRAPFAFWVAHETARLTDSSRADAAELAKQIRAQADLSAASSEKEEDPEAKRRKLSDTKPPEGGNAKVTPATLLPSVLEMFRTGYLYHRMSYDLDTSTILATLRKALEDGEIDPGALDGKNGGICLPTTDACLGKKLKLIQVKSAFTAQQKRALPFEVLTKIAGYLDGSSIFSEYNKNISEMLNHAANVGRDNTITTVCNLLIAKFVEMSASAERKNKRYDSSGRLEGWPATPSFDFTVSYQNPITVHVLYDEGDHPNFGKKTWVSVPDAFSRAYQIRAVGDPTLLMRKKNETYDWIRKEIFQPVADKLLQAGYPCELEHERALGYPVKSPEGIRYQLLSHLYFDEDELKRNAKHSAKDT